MEQQIQQEISHSKCEGRVYKGQFIHFQLLSLNYFKAVVMSFLMFISVFGLLFLKYFVSLRVKLFYDRLSYNESQSATHVYVRCAERNEEVCNVSSKQINGKMIKVFEFKHLQYQITQKQPKQLIWKFQENLKDFLTQEYQKKGLSYEQANDRQEFYGRNQHHVEVPKYLEYLFDILTKPFFIFQYFISITFIIQRYVIDGVLMITLSWITTSINYLLLRRSYHRIKQSAQRQYSVTVIRNRSLLQIKNTQLVPGDIYQLKNQIPCDSIVVKGDLFVNQAIFTGENMPLTKSTLVQPRNSHLSCHWIYQGSKIESTRDASYVLAMAVDVGFASKRGRIFRKILTKRAKQPQLFTKLIYFLLQVTFVTIVTYLATLNYVKSFNIDNTMVFIRLLDFIGDGMPAVLPIKFNVVFFLCLIRLSRQNIFGMQAQKTVESGRLKTLCFDKTGTLTQNKVDIKSIFHIESTYTLNQVQSLAHHPLIQGIFACCNSVQILSNIPKGDQIDLQMFMHSKAQIKNSSDPCVLRSITTKNQKFDILKINQYESRFQSMSVVVRYKEQGQNRYYIFAKGSPEMIHSYSKLKYQNYSQLIKDLSFEGFRSIAIAYRQIRESQLDGVLAMNRQEYLQSTTILGVVAFVNSLKSDAKETIQTLTQNDINTKIITGDNIYLAVRTAIITGIIKNAATVAVVEGKNYDKNTKSAQITKLSTSEKGAFTEVSEHISQFRFEQNSEIVYAIDNDFISARKNDFLHDSVKVFARISPENKALIVKKHKKIYQDEQSKNSFIQRIFGDCKLKVGMVGDGANDLIAIKEADIGIGLAQADAVYSASFVITNLLQIVQIIKQAKNTESQILDLVQFYTISRVVSVSDALILIQDTTYFTSPQHFYNNLINHTLIALMYAFSKPAKRLSAQLIKSNFMSLQNHLIFWGNALIITAGLLLVYGYYYQTDDFVPNPHPSITYASGYHGQTKSTTVIFLAQNVIFGIFPFLLYRSSPWKQPFYKNRPFTIFVGLLLVLIVVLIFTTQKLNGFAGLQPIGLSEMRNVLLIVLGTLVVILVFNKLVKSSRIRNKLKRKSEPSDQYKKMIDQ